MDSNPDPKPNPSSHRTDSSLKPKKTTRTMNPMSKSALKHSNMLSKVPRNLYSKKNRSASRGNNEATDMDDLECDDGASESVEGSEDFGGSCSGIDDGGSVGDGSEAGKVNSVKDNNISFDCDVSNIDIIDEIAKSLNNESIAASVKSVGDEGSLNSGSRDGNGLPASDLGQGNASCNKDNGPDVSKPSVGSTNLKHNVGSDKPRSPTKVSFGDVRVPGLFKVNGNASDIGKGVSEVSNFAVGESSGAKDAVMTDSVHDKNSRSFREAVSSSYGGNGNNKLHYVPPSIIGENRKVAKMDPILEEGCKRWGNTVVGFFLVGFV